MRISDVEAYVVGDAGLGSATWASYGIITKLVTSTGEVGYGEALPTFRPAVVSASIEQVARLYIGKEVERIRQNYLEVAKHDFYLPMSVESVTALSSIDMASWDVWGKELGAPISELIGGRLRDYVPAYANGWYAGCVTPEDFSRKAREALSVSPYFALKFDPFGAAYDLIDGKSLDMAERRVEAVAKVASEMGSSVMIEHHGRFSLMAAISVAERLAKYRPIFMEEPIHPDDVEGLRRYRSRVSLPVALGERILTPSQALLFMREGLVDVIQPDVCNVGGITGAKQVLDLADAFGIAVSPHNAFGPIQNAAWLQLASTARNLLALEEFYQWYPDWKRRLVFDSTPVEGGKVRVPDGPGLGVKVNESLLEELKLQPKPVDVGDEPVWVVRGTWGD
ncbi:mandelate racemase/muconate lactonizing enzyme family protein [Tardisphaera miroshnichenkoae]